MFDDVCSRSCCSELPKESPVLASAYNLLQPFLNGQVRGFVNI